MCIRDRDNIDWVHLNTVSYQAEDDTILISPRNLNSGVKLNWTTHEIVWILANPEVFKGTKYEKYVLTPDSDFLWHYRQHTVYQIDTDLDGNPDKMCIRDRWCTVQEKMREEPEWKN